MAIIIISLYAASYESKQFSYLNREHGLSDNNVECIFKDSDGLLWFGTRNGLCRFDGYEFKVFKKTDGKNSISGNRILDITEDNNGFIWIGTYKSGLNKLNKLTNEFTHYSTEQGIGARVNRIKNFKDSTIWICSTNGLAQYKHETNSFRLFYPDWVSDTTLKSNIVYDIIETSSGDIYVAPESNDIQKLYLEENRFESIRYARHPELRSNYRKRIVEDKTGTLWIAANYHGLSSYNPKTKESKIYTSETNHLSTNILMGSMELDTKGNLWICTEEDGLNIFNTKTKTYQHIKRDKEKKGTLSSNHTYTIYFDCENIAWIGTFDRGVNVYNPLEQKFFTNLFSSKDLSILNGISVLDIFEDTKKRVWIGTDGNGLFCFERGKEIRHYSFDKTKRNNILTTNVITSLTEDHLGNILIGTYAGGLISFNTKTNKVNPFHPDQNIKNGISSSIVWELIKDSKNRIWLGMLGTGADEYFPEQQTFLNYGPFSSDNNKIDFHNVMVISEDSDGDIWFGTEGNGVYILDNQTNKILRIPNDSIHKVTTEGIIKCIIQDKWGFLWIGTEDNGLFKLNKKDNSIKRYSIGEGQVSGIVQSLQEDNLGNLWIGTSEGIFRHDGKTDTFNRFIIEDGLSSNDFNPDGMTKLSDGRIIAGTKNGADIIDPSLIHLNQIVPKIIFTKLTVLNNEVFPNKEINDRVILTKNISYTNEIELSWKEKIFTLEFAALNYTLPQKCKFKYMLEGFEDNWVTTNADRRFASYSNLPPGKYVFKVLASNNDGKWGNNEKSLTINVKPPFHRTWFFKVSVFLILLGISLLIYRMRINIHKERYKQKQRDQERKIIELENEKLESEVKKMAFNILNKNKLLIEQKNKIQNLSNKAKESVKEGLHKIIDSIDADLDEEKDWKVIEPQIDKAYNQFISQLKQKHPDLAASEIRIAAYIRMNLSTKEICEFMNKTQRAVENDRYRLRKKIGLESNNSIKDYFMNL